MKAFAARLEDVVGRKALRRGEEAARFLASPVARGAEPLVVGASSATEVERVLASAHDAKVPVYIAGSSSRGMSWESLPKGPSVVLDLAKLDAILALDEVSLTVTTQTGITCAALERALLKRGFTLGFALGGFAEQVSIGGILATGLPPLSSPSRGTLAEHVVNVGWATPAGSRVRTRITPRSSTGPDLDALLLGARGLLGVMTEATLRMYREPEERMLLGFGFKTTSDAILTLAEVVNAGIAPSNAGIWPASPGAKRGARLAARYGGSAAWTRAVSGAAKKAFKDLGARLDPKPDESWFAHVDAAALRVGGATEPIWAYGSWQALARAAADERLSGPDAAFGVPTFDRHGGYAVTRMDPPDHEENDEADRIAALVEAGCTILRGPGSSMRPFSRDAKKVLSLLKGSFDPDRLLNPGNL